MKLHKYFPILLCFISASLLSQNDGNKNSKKHRFAFYGGIGPNYYFNNLAIAGNKVNPWNSSLTARLMWEPEHFLSLGIESGYYQLYTVHYSSQSLGSGLIRNTLVPLQLVVSTKFLKNYYANFSMGQSYLQNEVTNSERGNTSASNFSLADFGVTVGYRHIFKSRISIGTELKFYNSSKFNDSNLALVLVTGYRF